MDRGNLHMIPCILTRLSDYNIGPEGPVGYPIERGPFMLDLVLSGCLRGLAVAELTC